MYHPLIVGDFSQTISGSILVNATEYDCLLDCKNGTYGKFLDSEGL